MKNMYVKKIFKIIIMLAVINFSSIPHIAAKNVKKIEEKNKLDIKKEKKNEVIEQINEKLKLLDQREENSEKIVKKRFENFKEEDYQLEGFNLKVFKKNSSVILQYEHKKTGAYVVFIPVFNMEQLKEYSDCVCYRAPVKNDKGLVHLSEHCIVTETSKYVDSNFMGENLNFNAKTTGSSLEITMNSGFLEKNEAEEKQYIKELSKNLMLEDIYKNPELFENEKRRVLSEMKNVNGNLIALDEEKIKGLDKFSSGGDISKISKIKLAEYKQFVDRYIQPSNCLIIKNLYNLNSKRVKNYLKTWDESYFKKFKRKKIKISSSEQLKDVPKYRKIDWPKDSPIFKVFKQAQDCKIGDFKYVANIYYEKDFKFPQMKQLEVLNLINVENEELFTKLVKFCKKLGYEGFRKSFYFTKNGICGYLVFCGNNKKLFEKKTLKKNAKNFFEYAGKLFKSLNDEEIFKLIYKPLEKTPLEDIKLNEKDKLQFDMNQPQNYFNLNIGNRILNSFIELGVPITKEMFYIKNEKELENYRALKEKNIKQNLDVFDILAKKEPKQFRILKKSNKTMRQTYEKILKKYKIVDFVFPVGFKNVKDPVVYNVAADIFSEFLKDILDLELGIVYAPFSRFFPFEITTVCWHSNKESAKDAVDFLKRNFKQIIKIAKVKDSVFKEQKEVLIKETKQKYEEMEVKIPKLKNLVNGLEEYLKTGKFQKDFRLNEKSTIMDLMFSFGECMGFTLLEICNSCDMFFENYDEYFKLYIKIIEFNEKYVKLRNEKIDKKVVKAYLKIINPFLEKCVNLVENADILIKKYNKITKNQIQNIIKNAYLIEDKSKINRINNFFEEILKRNQKIVENL